MVEARAGRSHKENQRVCERIAKEVSNEDGNGVDDNDNGVAGVRLHGRSRDRDGSLGKEKEMKYIIKIDYSVTLTFSNYDDFMSALGILAEGGVEELKVYFEKEDK